MTLKDLVSTHWDWNTGVVSAFHDDRLFCQLNLVVLAFKGLFACAESFHEYWARQMQRLRALTYSNTALSQYPGSYPPRRYQD